LDACDGVRLDVLVVLVDAVCGAVGREVSSLAKSSSLIAVAQCSGGGANAAIVCRITFALAVDRGRVKQMRGFWVMCEIGSNKMLACRDIKIARALITVLGDRIPQVLLDLVHKFKGHCSLVGSNL